MDAFEIYQDKLGGWRWRVKATNGEKLANSGEGYARRIDAVHGALLTFQILEGERAAGLLKGAQ